MIDFPKGPGIYLIKHRKDGAVFVGFSTNMKRRINEHKQTIGSPKPRKELTESKDALRAGLKGRSVEEVYEISILEEISNPTDLKSAVGRWIDDFRARGIEMYNVRR